MKEAAASRDLAIIVHGSNVHTWWRRLANGGYSWWRGWSLFSDALRSAYGSDLTIREFRWSGLNTHDARLTAGQSLASMIAALPSGTRVHLITHSHGGNVALAAINRLPPRQVACLVLLANPHITVPQGDSPSVPYWGDAHTRVERIWNLFSESDYIQTHGVRWRHGFPPGKVSTVQVSRVYDGPGSESVHNHAIRWRTILGAHRAMHSSAVGVLVGNVLKGIPLPDAMVAARLRTDAENRVPDYGGYGGTEWAEKRIRERSDPSPFDFNGDARDIGLLLVHGFTASPSEMRPLSTFVQEHSGWRCKALLLPGHGTRIEDMDDKPAGVWLNAVRSTLDELAAQCRYVFLAGLSLGAVLCCHAAMAENRPANLRGVILMAPAFAVAASRARALSLLRTFRKTQPKGPFAVHYFLEHRLFSYPELHLPRAVEVLQLGRQAWENLDKLKGMPTLLLAGELDRNVSVPHMIAAARRNPWIEFVRLPASRHILTVEPDRVTAFEAIVSFVSRCAVEE